MRKIPLSILAVLALPATALAATDHRGEVHKVCWASTWVERAPADHPIAPAYKGDTFRVTRAGYANARNQSWAKGVLTHHEPKGKQKTFTYRGWVRVAALRGC
jgi:hypothetical protein